MKKFIRFLKNEYPTSEHCEIEILYGYDSLQAPDGSMGFGVYIPDEKKIYVAGDIPEPETNIPHTIAHEYRHFMQDLINKPFDEDDAEKFADKVCKDYYTKDGDTE